MTSTTHGRNKTSRLGRHVSKVQAQVMEVLLFGIAKYMYLDVMLMKGVKSACSICLTYAGEMLARLPFPCVAFYVKKCKYCGNVRT